jgi:hypothetical protein
MNVIDYNLFNNFFQLYGESNFYDATTCNYLLNTKQWSGRKKVNLSNYLHYNYSPKLYTIQLNLLNYSNSLWISALNLFKVKKKKKLYY